MSPECSHNWSYCWIRVLIEIYLLRASVWSVEFGIVMNRFVLGAERESRPRLATVGRATTPAPPKTNYSMHQTPDWHHPKRLFLFPVINISNND